ncbi:alpha/beta hydrolase, partial [uncultured Methylobacterium sp.]
AELRQAAEEARSIDVPTLVIHGAADTCLLPASFEGQKQFFTGTYRQVELEGVGHFPTREAPEKVAEALLAHLGEVGEH